MKYLSLDLEITTTPDMSRDWSEQHPFGISCLATWASDEGNPRVWVGQNESGIMSQMGTLPLGNVASYLEEAARDGYAITTVNGAGFDFRELAESAPIVYWRTCKHLARHHIDMFYHVFCALGYAPGLDAMAKGMGLPGKTEGMDGAKAPEMWRNGEYGKVIDYLVQDVRTTLDVALAVDAAKALRWTSKSGKEQVLPIERWLTVDEASELPVPDTSWMKGGWSREKFVGWLS